MKSIPIYMNTTTSPLCTRKIYIVSFALYIKRYYDKRKTFFFYWKISVEKYGLISTAVS